MNTIKIDDIKVTDYQRETLSWLVDEIIKGIKEYGYTLAYPIVLDKDNNLVDGGHRLEAAKICKLNEVPFILKPEGVSNIAYALRCNADRAKGREDDVFDLSELCYKMSTVGNLTGQQIADELGWGSKQQVSLYLNIKTKLHPMVWNLTRYGSTRNPNLFTGTKSCLVDPQSTIVDWLESYFRPIISNLGLTERDNAIMRGQLKVIYAVYEHADKKITAKWIKGESEKQGWYIKLKKYMRDNLNGLVELTERKYLIKSINNGVYGKKEDKNNFEKFKKAVSKLNEDVLGVILYYDDMLQRLPLLEDKSINLVIIDPPYNVKTDVEWDKIGTDEEFLECIKSWLSVIKSKLADEYQLFMFCDVSYNAPIEMLLREENWPIKSRIIWEYRNLVKGRDVVDKFIQNWQMCFHIGNHSLNWSDDWNDERFIAQINAGITGETFLSVGYSSPNFANFKYLRFEEKAILDIQKHLDDAWNKIDEKKLEEMLVDLFNLCGVANAIYNKWL